MCSHLNIFNFSFFPGFKIFFSKLTVVIKLMQRSKYRLFSQHECLNLMPTVITTNNLVVLSIESGEKKRSLPISSCIKVFFVAISTTVKSRKLVIAKLLLKPAKLIRWKSQKVEKYNRQRATEKIRENEIELPNYDRQSSSTIPTMLVLFLA